jgi:hypothetical protein
MKRRTLFALIAALSMAILGIITGSKSASAQPPIVQCPGGCYTIDLSLVQPDCWPCVQTVWANGVIWPPTVPPRYHGGNIYTECPPVPPGTPLQNIIICRQALPPVPGQYTIICDECPLPLCVVICTDAQGCLYIKFYPGPCPPNPLPCP